ncbi:ATP-binding protein [Chloroflexota bacterium]
MGRSAENTANMILRTTGSLEKAEDYRKRMKETIERVNKIVKKEIDSVYRELAAKIDERLKDSRYFPWILEKLMTLEQARAVAALPDKYREPSTGAVALSPEGMGVSERFAKDLGMDKETVGRYLTDLYYKGVLFPTRQGWQSSRSLGQFSDSATNNPVVHDSLGREYFELWAAFLEEQGNEIRFDLLKRFEDAGMTQWRVIPRWKSIKDIPGVLPCEDVREILRRAQENISLTNCPCRQRFANRTCDVPGETCINFGRAAEYNIVRGSGRKVTLKEALDAFNELDKYPVVHLARNQKEVETGILCNCHWDCCGPFQGLLSQPEYKPAIGMTKSRFEAVVDPEKCIGCKTCVELCSFEAIGMRYYPEYGEERSYIDTEKCMGCGCCVINCPVGARTMRMWQPDPDYIPDLRVNV